MELLEPIKTNPLKNTLCLAAYTVPFILVPQRAVLCVIVRVAVPCCVALIFVRYLKCIHVCFFTSPFVFMYRNQLFWSAPSDDTTLQCGTPASRAARISFRGISKSIRRKASCQKYIISSNHTLKSIWGAYRRTGLPPSGAESVEEHLVPSGELLYRVLCDGIQIYK